MILTVTPNPSIDLLHETEKLVWEDANRVEMPRRRAGGQGINLTRAARVLGGESEAVACVGGNAGAELQALLRADATPLHAIPIAHETRVFVAVREAASGRSLLINPRGPVLDDKDRDCLLERVTQLCAERTPDWLVCTGSIPRGLNPDLYACMARIAHAASCRFIADCDGGPLQLAIEAGVDLLAPNQHEAERLLDRPITSIREASGVARELLKAAPRVLLKLGARGALLATAEQCWYAQAPVMRRGSAVGAGDAFLAAFLVADKNAAPPEEALRAATAAGAAVLLSEGSELLRLADYETLVPQVELQQL